MVTFDEKIFFKFAMYSYGKLCKRWGGPYYIKCTRLIVCH